MGRGRRGAFTLLELMIAVAILGVLTAIALPAFFNYIRDARLAEGVRMLGELWRAQEEHRMTSEAGMYSQCFKGSDPVVCLPGAQGSAQVSVRPLSFRPPANSKFNLIVGSGALENSESSVVSSAFFMSEASRNALGIPDSQASISGNARFGYETENTTPGEPPLFWMGAETIIDGRYELMGLRGGQLFQICAGGEPGAHVNVYTEGFGTLPDYFCNHQGASEGQGRVGGTGF